MSTKCYVSLFLPVRRISFEHDPTRKQHIALYYFFGVWATRNKNKDKMCAMSLVFDYSFFLQGLCSMFTPLWSLLSLLFPSNVPCQGVCSSCSAFAVTSAMETCVQRAASSEGLDSTIVEFSNSSMLNFITLNSHILRFLRRSSSRDEPTKLARLCFQQV